MSASDSEPEENFCFFGKPLDPYDEDTFPKRKPIAVEDQIATDTHGRRRFHGAFTGGFSAGFFNTVGSLEGWTPSEFKSSRDEKASKYEQRPQDFMDDEDMGEHGIAPQTVRATRDYSTVQKRKLQVFSEGPIPGEPVLETLLTSGNETVGYLLLKNLGIKDKINKRDEEMRSIGKVYGCQMPIHYKISETIEHKQYEVPEIYKEYLSSPKSNTFGLGYKGLDRSHVNLFQSSNLVVRDKNNKKFSISGQAFGVGAFEVEDEDIYTKEDMTNYDFELTKETSSIERKNIGHLVFGLFKKANKSLIVKLSSTLPTIPHSFTGKHKVKKSRFDPLPDEKAEEVSRHAINPSIRARYLGENDDKMYTQSKPIIELPSASSAPVQEKLPPRAEPKKEFDVSSVLISDRFVSASSIEDNVSEPIRQPDETHGTEQMRAAVKMKMFGPLTRISSDWQPCALLCKRFNVPEPFTEQSDNRSRKRTKNLIFQNQKFEDDNLPLHPGISQESAASLLNPIKQEDNVDESSQPDPSIISTSENMDENKNSKPENTETLLIDITDKIDIAEKTDLFKAVFLSSSESEDEKEEDEKEDKDKAEAFKSSVLCEPLIPKIKPLKQGILSDINSHTFTKPGSQHASDDKKLTDKPDNNNLLLEVETSNNLNFIKERPEENHKEKHSNSSPADVSKLEKIREDNERKDRHKKKRDKYKKRDKSQERSESDKDRVRKHKKSKHKKKKEKHKDKHKTKKRSRY